MTNICSLGKACHVFLEAGSQRKVLISWLLELFVHITVFWRGKRGGTEKGLGERATCTTIAFSSPTGA